jgi:glutathione S-transferase
MGLTVYDLAGAQDDCRFSPYCWRVRLALAHKGLEAEFLPWRFTEKERLVFSGQDRVPVLVDGETVVSDSWAIMTYLDEAYPERPLFDTAQARAEATFLKYWAEMVLQPALAPLVLNDIYRAIHEKDRNYFRTSREKAFGCRLEDLPGDATARLKTVRQVLAPLRRTLGGQPFLGGAAPSGADFLPYGAFQWVAVVSGTTFLEPDDPITAWRQRVAGWYGDALDVR